MIQRADRRLFHRPAKPLLAVGTQSVAGFNEEELNAAAAIPIRGTFVPAKTPSVLRLKLKLRTCPFTAVTASAPGFDVP